jgi:hypothetical protein
MKRLKFSRDEIDIDIDDRNGAEKQTGRLKANKMPVQCCEDCGQWMLLAEYPSTHRTWICKVCQGFAKDPEMHEKTDVGYHEYLNKLNSIKDRKKALHEKYAQDFQDLEKERKDLVVVQYAKYKNR